MTSPFFNTHIEQDALRRVLQSVLKHVFCCGIRNGTETVTFDKMVKVAKSHLRQFSLLLICLFVKKLNCEKLRALSWKLTQVCPIRCDFLVIFTNLPCGATRQEQNVTIYKTY